MKTTVSSKGQIVLPAELRHMDRVKPGQEFDVEAELLARLRTGGKATPIKDSLIAATALVHGLAVATRNRADFAKAGVRMVDTFVG